MQNEGDIQSYVEQSVTDNSGHIMQQRREEIDCAKEILQQADEVMKHKSSQSGTQDNKRDNTTVRRVTYQHTQHTRGTEIRTRSQTPTYLYLTNA